MRNHKIIVATIALAAATALAPVSVQAHTLEESAFTQVEGTMLYVSEGASVNTAAHLEEYCALPETIRTSLVSNHCKIYLESTAEEGGPLMCGTVDSMGVFHSNGYSVNAKDYRQIYSIFALNYIDVLSDMDVQHPITLLHEVGHFVDYNAYGGWEQHGCYEIASGTEEWKGLFATYASTVGGFSSASSAAVGTPAQFFATSFAWYILDPTRLLSTCPAVHAYIEDVVASY